MTIYYLGPLRHRETQESAMLHEKIPKVGKGGFHERYKMAIEIQFDER